MINNDFLWCEKYRPKTISDCVLPDDLKDTFQTFINQKNIPNLLLTGGPGVGKTTVARAMLEELGCDYIIINGSLNGNIDTLRNEISSYASSMSMLGRKYVILDEADYLNANSTQPALRNFMEEYSKNCGFILTANFSNRIIEPLQSRCSVVHFNIKNSEKPKLAALFFKRACKILDENSVEYEKPAVAEFINKHFPDWRRVLNELQRYSATGKIDSGILVSFTDDNYKNLIGYLKNKEWTNMRKWVNENSDIDSIVIMRRLYDTSYDIMKPQSIPNFVITLAEYEYRSAFMPDKEINLVAFLTQIMSDVEWQ